jgi:CBS domain-containing protein
MLWTAATPVVTTAVEKGRRAMKCQDLMTLDLRWVRDKAPILDAAVAMRDSSIGFLPVIDEAGALVGVLTDRDLVTRAMARNLPPATTPVSEVMSPKPVVCLEEEPIERVEAVMVDNQISRLPVLGPGNRVVGVISLTDVVIRRRGGEALRTARGVLARDGAGPHEPLDSIHLTPSDPSEDVRPRPSADDYSRTRDEARSVEIGRYPGVR